MIELMKKKPIIKKTRFGVNDDDVIIEKAPITVKEQWKLTSGVDKTYIDKTLM